MIDSIQANYKSAFLNRLDRWISNRPTAAFIGSALILGGGVVLALELLARCWFAPFPQLMPTEHKYNPYTLWENRENHTFVKRTQYGDITFRSNAFGFRADDMEKDKSEKKRVLCAGDSTTWGFDVPFESIYAQRLNETLGEKTEAISCGTWGYSVAQCILQIKHKLLEFKPDVITVSSNFNDRRFRYFDRLNEDESTFRKIHFQYRLYEYLCYSRLFQTVSSLYNALKQHNVPPPPVDELICRVPLDAYRKNLEAICELSKEQGFDVIFIGLYDNPKTFALIDRYEKEEDLSRKIEILKKAVKTPKAGLYGLALRKLAELAKQEKIEDSEIAVWETKYAYFKTIHGGFIIEDDEPYRELMKETARQYGVRYLDFFEYAMKIEDVKNQRMDLFLKSDPCHLNIEGHALLAEALLPLIRDCVE